MAHRLLTGGDHRAFGEALIENRRPPAEGVKARSLANLRLRARHALRSLASPRVTLVNAGRIPAAVRCAGWGLFPTALLFSSAFSAIRWGFFPTRILADCLVIDPERVGNGAVGDPLRSTLAKLDSAGR